MESLAYLRGHAAAPRSCRIAMCLDSQYLRRLGPISPIQIYSLDLPVHAIETNVRVMKGIRLSSTTFTQCALQATEFDEKTQNMGHFAVQGHRFWYQSKVHTRIRLPISDQY